jgi:hypothetical protein
MIKFKVTVPEHVREGWYKQLGEMPSEAQLAIANGISTRFASDGHGGAPLRDLNTAAEAAEIPQCSSLFATPSWCYR